MMKLWILQDIGDMVRGAFDSEEKAEKAAELLDLEDYRGSFICEIENLNDFYNYNGDKVSAQEEDVKPGSFADYCQFNKVSDTFKSIEGYWCIVDDECEHPEVLQTGYTGREP